MRRRVSPYLSSVALIFLAACGGGSGSGVTTLMQPLCDPEYYGARSFANLCVSSEIADIDSCRALENAVVEELCNHGVQAISCTELFGSEQEHTDEERAKLLTELGYDGVLVLELVENGPYERHFALAMSPSVFGRTDYYRHDTNHKQSARLNTTLTHVTTRSVAWTAESRTGDVFADFSGFCNSYASVVVEELLADSVFAVGECASSSDEAESDLDK